MSALALTAAVVLIALSQLAGSADGDGDGRPDRMDSCPGTPRGRAVDADGCCAAARALSAGVRALLADSSGMRAGETWLLKELSEIYSDPDLERLIAQATKNLAADKGARLLDPGAAKTSLPPSPGRGAIKLMYYVLAPMGAPESRGIEFIRDFLAHPESGYVLTHQFLVLEWAKDVGLELPESLRAKRSMLLKGIAAEQASDPEFSDLYAERVALLLAFGTVPLATAAGWIDTILAAQTPEGRWVDNENRRVTYDGQTFLTAHPWAHTSGFAAAALGFYLHR